MPVLGRFGRHGQLSAGISLDLRNCVYVAELSGGVVKVGFSHSPRARINSLSRYVEQKKGLRLLRFALFAGRQDTGCYPLDPQRNERRAIAALLAIATPVPRHLEYFTGISFDAACAVVAPVIEA